jgi:hypothetical protein
VKSRSLSWKLKSTRTPHRCGRTMSAIATNSSACVAPDLRHAVVLAAIAQSVHAQFHDLAGRYA